MKENNKKLYILVSVLLIGVGLTFAYFVGKTIFSGTGASTEARTATVNGSILDIEGELVLDNNMYPGHKTLSKITATATGDNEPILYNLIWKGINGLNTTLKYKVYRTEEKKEINITCTPKKKVINGEQHINEECTGNIEELGKEINEGEIKTTSGEEQETIILAMNELITSKPKPGETYYYYVIIEYPDTGEGQNKDIGQNFDGRVKGEISNSKADINIIGIHKENEEGGYTKTDKIPEREEGLTLNTSESHCTKEATLNWNERDWSLEVTNLTQSGTDCELYFRNYTNSEKTLSVLNLISKGYIGQITGPSCSGNTSLSCYSTDSSHKNMAQNGVYEAEDDFGTSYVYRGTINNNWVKFGKENNEDIWWRIIRINGNGTIRLIYAGKGSTAPSTIGTGTQVGTSSYNTYYNDNKYVGFMYGTQADGVKDNESETGTTDGARSGNKPAHLNNYNSTIKDKLDEWWVKTNLGNSGQIERIDDSTGFCNDREPIASNHGSIGTNTYGKNKAGYASAEKVWQSESTNYNSTEQKPTLKCGNDQSKQYDLFTGQNAEDEILADGKIIKGNHALTNPVGLITMDEVIYAGGFAGAYNNNYWLYTSDYYWTMSSCGFYDSGAGLIAQVFWVDSSGMLASHYVYYVRGVRPVINLRANTKFTTLSNGYEPGTSNNPYVVE